jgi:hypothetical protein
MPGNSTSADSRRERGGAQARAMADIDQVLAGALAAGTHKVPTAKTALSALSPGRRFLRSGVAGLDRILRGGFPCRFLRYPLNLCAWRCLCA